MMYEKSESLIHHCGTICTLKDRHPKEGRAVFQLKAYGPCLRRRGGRLNDGRPKSQHKRDDHLRHHQ
jgi:hypothetical protein